MSESIITLEKAQQFIDAANHCHILGFRVSNIDNGTLTLEMPYSDSIVGNPDSGVVHGGALTTLLDTACGFSVPLKLHEFELCPTLDLRIDYMRAAKPHIAIFAQAQAYRVTEHIVFTKGCAYQEDPANPVARCAATFMRLPDSRTITSP